VTVVVAGYVPLVTATVQDNPAEKRYEVHVDGELAGFATYHLSGPRITLIHTEVDDAYEGQGIGKLLAEYVLDAARDAGLAVIPKCPFMAKYIRETREYVDLVPENRRAEFGLDEATDEVPDEA
jgi:predicted GNAT family acetyltransferase